MEATALSVGKSVLDGALGYAQSAIAEELALQLGVRRDHDFIRDELEMMLAFLMAAHEERDEHKVVKTWVKQVRDVAYDVEDSLQDFAVRLGNPSWWRILRKLRDRRCVAMRMKELRAKVEDVSQRNVRYQLIKGSGSKAATTMGQSSLVSATMSGTEEAVRQRNKAKLDLIRLIHDMKDEDLRVIAIWGTSNVFGETSIVKRAYDDLMRDNKFECQAWVSITNPFDPIQCLQNIVRQLYVDSLHEKSSPGASDLRRMVRMKGDDLVRPFQTYVSEKSFLIVVSNLSTIEELDHIKARFPDSYKKRSRFIVCTEKAEVASLCVGTDTEIPEHKQLSTDPALLAFFEKDRTYPMDPSPSSRIYITDNNDSANGNRLTRMGTMISAFKESQLIGRMDEKTKILKMVLDNSSQEFQVISICGMGGLGKTTLAKYIFQNQELCNMFEKRACVTVKRPFNRDELINSLATQLADRQEAEGDGGNRERPRNPRSLTDTIGGKKYLVVLDDLYSTAEWDAIIHQFPRTEGSRIIITTRVESIANHCSKKEENIHKLQTLGEKDACNLFTEKVFGNIIDLNQQYPELAEVAKLILKKCNGLPLAIVTIGGFLSKQSKTPMEWRKLNEHIGAEMEMNHELGTIKDILGTSYDGLPYHLKSCFLYLSIFPEDHNISRRRLVLRWIAEGYCSKGRGRYLKDTSDSYFMELIDRSMILPVKWVFRRKGIDSCQIHDLMREISISKSMEENLVFRVEEGCEPTNIMGRTRHLSISSNWVGDKSEFESATDLSRVRSLTVFGRWRPFFISDKMRLLRVLDLENTYGLVDHHLDHIGRLLHLKYVSLRGCYHISHLPDSWGNLLQLETLDIKGTCIRILPKCIIKLRKLQHFFGGVDSISGVVLPKGVRKLKQLHTLGRVNIAGGGTILDDIGRLTQLRKLAIQGMTKENSGGLCFALGNLSRLESLSIKNLEEEGELDGCLDGLSTPPSNLQSLKLRYLLMVKLPEWISGLQNLVKLQLVGTRLTEVDATMQVLGKLPNLAILRLFRSFHGNFSLTFHQGAFPSLMVLDLWDPQLSSLRFKDGATPKLELLRVLYVGNSMISGLASLASLKEVTIKAFSADGNKEFWESLQAQVAKHPNGIVVKRL